MNNWTWNENLSTWLYGEENNGCGVYKDRDGWWANVCLGNDFHFIGPVTSQQEAMQEAEHVLQQLVANQ
jgi:hypothetical protein